MSSSLPGMDPYIEAQAFWPDFHARFITYWCDALTDSLPDHYEARIDERVGLLEIPEPRKLIKPDIAVEHTGEAAKPWKTTSGVMTVEPVEMSFAAIDEKVERYIEILHRPERRLVAILELLSPTNKEGPGRDLYLGKRGEIMFQAVHLVELDLLP